MRYSVFTVLFLLGFIALSAQKIKDDQVKVIEFSGMVFTEGEDGSPVPLPYTNVSVMGTSRGTSTDIDGFFSFVALAGETVVFSRIGYKTVNINIPDTLQSHQYKWIQIMSEDNYLLPEAVIFPWPSRDHFKQEFLAIDISNELREKAKENLAEEVMSEMRYTIPADGKETSSLVLRQQATEYVYTGQIKPQNVFNPLAWKKFIEAWKRGDFKSKEKK
jgi:hypothetical protein